MTPLFFYDTETTGLVDFRAPSEAEHQPHIVQIAGCLVNPDTREIIASIDVVVKPDGWTIPEEVAAIHGITTEYALSVGVPEKMAVGLFVELWNGNKRIAHNESFDARILRIAQHRFGYSESQLETWKSCESECTMKKSTPILQLPPTAKMQKAGFNTFKNPNLREAYRHFFGEDFENAHSAMADVKACIAVYFSIQDTKDSEAVKHE